MDVVEISGWKSERSGTYWVKAISDTYFASESLQHLWVCTVVVER